MADSLLSIEVSIEGSEPDDWLSVAVTLEALTETLCTRQLDLGDTAYECNWDGRSNDDGLYPLEVVTYDRAGNTNRAFYAVDLDTRGPSLTITEPEGTHLSTLPERAAGTAFDRGGLDSLGFRFLADTDHGPVVTEVSGDTVYWHVPWPESLLSDGSYQLQIYARDVPGHTAIAGIDIAIDTDAPDTPVLAALPEEVHSPLLEITGTCSARDSLLLYLNGTVEERLVCTSTGTFSALIIVGEGTNTIQAGAKDRAGNRSPLTDVHTVIYTKRVGFRVPEILKPGSVMDFTLAEAADLITLRVFTLEGSYVATVSKPAPDIVDEITWDLADSGGDDVRNGVYLLIFEIDYSGGGREVEKKAVMVIR
jgi:hypothetical protein